MLGLERGVLSLCVCWCTSLGCAPAHKVQVIHHGECSLALPLQVHQHTTASTPTHQVNTSGEESKSGVEPNQVVPLVQHVLGCKYLTFGGLMTIGMPDYTSRPENFEVRNSLYCVVLYCSVV